MNSNGVVSFRIPFINPAPRPFPLLTNDILIAPFWDFINTFDGGRVFFRLTDDEDLLEQVGNTINEADFSPELLLIATWDGVPGIFAPSFVRLYKIINRSWLLVF